jgi:hypothetical protein
MAEDGEKPTRTFVGLTADEMDASRDAWLSSAIRLEQTSEWLLSYRQTKAAEKQMAAAQMQLEAAQKQIEAAELAKRQQPQARVDADLVRTLFPEGVSNREQGITKAYRVALDAHTKRGKPAFSYSTFRRALIELGLLICKC